MASVKMSTAPAVTVALAGTRVQITATDTNVSAVTFFADSLNTGKIYIGASDVTSSNGIELGAGESVTISAENLQGVHDSFVLSDFWVDSAENGNLVRVAYIKRR